MLGAIGGLLGGVFGGGSGGGSSPAPTYIQEAADYTTPAIIGAVALIIVVIILAMKK
jgi:uncharacterized membrane protein YfcA